MAKPDRDQKTEITAEWREMLLRTMQERRISQHQLATLTGVTQNAISLILRGQQHYSKHVVTICKALKLPLPQRYADDLARQWAELGESMREESPEVFEQALRLVESMASALKTKA